MNTRNFEVLYTHQKLKKAKTWQDGCLKISSNGTKAVLFDDQGCSLEVFHIHSYKIFPGSDVECERYLISIGDEKISEGSIQDNSSTGPVFPDSNNALCYGANNGPAIRSNLRSALGKRKRDFHDIFRPDLPRPREDFNLRIPGFGSDHFGSDHDDKIKNAKNVEYNELAALKTGDAYELCPQKPYQRTMMNSKRRTDARDCNTKATATTATLRYDRLVPNTSTVEDFYPQKTYQGMKSMNSKGSIEKRDMINYNTKDTDGNFDITYSTFGGENSLLHPQRSFQRTNENSFPTQKRNRLELLSLFGGKRQAVQTKQNHSSKKQNHFSKKQNHSSKKQNHSSIASPQQNLSKVCDSENVFYKKPFATSNNPFSQAFDMSFGDEDEFSDTSFQTSYNPKSTINVTTPWINAKPWLSDEPDIADDNVCHDEYIVPEIDDVLLNYSHENNSKSNHDFTSETLTLPWKSNVSQVTSSCNDFEDEDFDEEMGDVALDHDDDNDNDGFELVSISSKNIRSLAANKVDDDTPLQENATEREELNDIPSRSILQSHRLHSSSRNNQFTPPLIVQNNPRESQSYQKDFRSSNIERAPRALGSSIRPQSLSGELYFPSNTECCDSVIPTRQVIIPTKFTTAMEYKGILKSSLREHLNIILFELAQKYHGIISKADIASSDDGFSDQKENVKGPSCSHGPAKLRAVKKDGPNKGRHFYTCPGSGSNQCKFFQWADERHTTSKSGTKKISLTSTDSIRVFFKSEGIYFYHNCLLERRSQPTKFFGKKYSRKGSNLDNGKKVMYLVLKYRDSSSLYTKDDIWIISKSINFEPRTTFVAKSMFYGPSSSGDLEIEPISGYSSSNWRSGDTVHAIWVCNAGTELSCIQNIDDYVTLQQMPLLPYIMNGSSPSYSSQRIQRRVFTTPVSQVADRNSLGISWQVIEQETEEMIVLHKLNTDQATALYSCAKMFVSETEERMKCLPITLIHGVFGAGKSFLLAIVVLLMVRLFEIADASDEARTGPITWKILISSTTNVAVDRILLGLLDLGFCQFVRVGSVRKIAKPVLPYSIHSTGTESQELKELQGMLKTELTSSEKAHVRKSIEMHKLGENRKRLANVRVVGVTCAACTFAALEKLKFPVLLLDECSQMTEPASLLPMARFACRKLVLVGDPKQLNPTIQGSEPSHDSGLEQTMFDRFIKMDLKPILLRMQYRCHPVISSISNRLFYNDHLLDGVNAEEREPLVDFVPTLCFYNVSNGKEECSQDGSYFNSAEAKFVVVLIKSLLESDVEPKQIGVITQYKSQLTTITSSLSEDGETSHKELAGIQISTVDAFQGGEKDVIILSCVRTKHIGFIDCKRRTNVALTRAKRHLCIVGCGKILSSNPLWSKILTFCRESADGFQSSDSYIKLWNERRSRADEEDTSSKSKKKNGKRKSRKSDGSCTSKRSNKIPTQDCSIETEAIPRCDSSSNKRSVVIPVEEIFDSEPTSDNENIHTDQISDFVDNADLYDVSHQHDAIEISDNPEIPQRDISNADVEVIGISANSHNCSVDIQKDLQNKNTVVEKVANDSKSCDFSFGDDSFMDDQLCSLDF